MNGELQKLQSRDWRQLWDTNEDTFLYNELRTQYGDDLARIRCINTLIYDYNNDAKVTLALLLRLIDECTDPATQDKYWDIVRSLTAAEAL